MGFLEMLSIGCIVGSLCYAVVSWTYIYWPSKAVEIVNSDLQAISLGKKKELRISISYGRDATAGRKKWEVVRSARRIDSLYARVSEKYELHNEIRIYCDPILAKLKIPESPFHKENMILSMCMLIVSVGCLFFTRVLGY